MTVLRVALPFTPRPWQRPLLDDRSPRIVAVVHRRAGKSTGIMWRGLRKALTHQRRDPPPRVIHTLPYSVQWQRTGLWDQFERAIAGIPGAELRKAEQRAIMPNGGVYQCGGMDRPDTWRGGYADEFIEDECDDTSGANLETVIEPMLIDHLGTRIKSGTPKGVGRLKEAYEKAGHTDGWNRYLLRWQDTGVIGAIVKELEPEKYETALARLRQEMSDEEFAQEMECSFEAPNSGAIYAKQLAAAERDGRIRDVPYDPALPVITAWDLGIADHTVIWFAQITRFGEWRIIDWLAGQGESLDYYVRELKARPYTYGEHILPHDVEVRELQSGKSRRHFLDGLGVRPIRVLPAANPADRISAVRAALPKCYFDARKTEMGRKFLWAYRREWNETLGVFRSEPVHDEASHSADSFGHLCQGAREPLDERNMRLPRQAQAWDLYA